MMSSKESSPSSAARRNSTTFVFAFGLGYLGLTLSLAWLTQDNIHTLAERLPLDILISTVVATGLRALSNPSGPRWRLPAISAVAFSVCVGALRVLLLNAKSADVVELLYILLWVSCPLSIVLERKCSGLTQSLGLSFAIAVGVFYFAITGLAFDVLLRAVERRRARLVRELRGKK
jgi:bacteriorhodopsin